MRFNSQYNVWQDDETGMTYQSKTGLLAKVKRFNLDIPDDPFLSNRFVINNIKYKREAGE